MHEHDLDLIAALAEGSLEEPAAARALVESCAECRSEFQAQQRALSALKTAEPVMLSADERVGLRAAIWGQIKPREALVKSKRPWWIPAGAVAAGTLVLVAVLGVLNEQQSGGGNAQLEMATTTAAGAETFAEADSATAAPAGDEAETFGYGGASRASLEELASGDAEVVGAAIRDFLLETEAKTAAESERDLATLQAVEIDCIDRIDEGTVEAVAVAQLEGEMVMVFAVEDESGLQALVLDQNTCTPIELTIPG